MASGARREVTLSVIELEGSVSVWSWGRPELEWKVGRVQINGWRGREKVSRVSSEDRRASE